MRGCPGGIPFRLPLLRGDAKFSNWLYRIAVNQAKTRRKSMMTSMQRMVPLESEETMGDSLRNPEEDAKLRETHDIVHQVLGTSDGNDELIILMRNLQDIPYEEIACVLEVPNGTVKSRLHRARRALKAKLAPYFQPA
ncbi:MAG: sigma-70 family RNA polymerase sigma factor [Candidatus Binatia bacterium]|nr:sigma-70 family RNA polymerase sigma factor [Candidatus Binatia bacterium]